jgi:hypothetical protein
MDQISHNDKKTIIVKLTTMSQVGIFQGQVRFKEGMSKARAMVRALKRTARMIRLAILFNCLDVS